MKISGSHQVLFSENHFEQMDLSLNEKTRERTNSQPQRLTSNPDIRPQVIVDRVSIIKNETQEGQFNYDARVTGKSSVTSLTSGDIKDFEQQSVVEKMIGGVMDKEIVINHIRRKEDISFSENKTETVDVPDRQPGQLPARLDPGWEMRLMRTDIHYEEETLAFSSSGEVATEDGRRISFSLDLSLDKKFLSRTEQQTITRKWQERINLTDPLVISLDGKTPQLSDVSFEFDLDADGKTENISFAGNGSGFLAFDRNNDRVINNGSELFGPGTGNGFGELAVFDEDQNNWIDENDAVFSKLSVWTKDENGKDRLISLKNAGIGAISLDYADTQFDMTESDNRLTGQLKRTGVALFENGTVGLVQQIDLATRLPDDVSKDPVPDNSTPEHDIQRFSDSPQTVFINTDNGFSSTTFVEPASSAEISNPLKDLMERIEKLKQQMGRLLEKMNPTTQQSIYKRSARQPYQTLNPDPSVLLSGVKDPVRSRRRYG